MRVIGTIGAAAFAFLGCVIGCNWAFLYRAIPSVAATARSWGFSWV
jgi:hypothetical protein